MQTESITDNQRLPTSANEVNSVRPHDSLQWRLTSRIATIFSPASFPLCVCVSCLQHGLRHVVAYFIKPWKDCQTTIAHTLHPIVLRGSAAAVISVRVFYARKRAKMSLRSHSHTDELHVKRVCLCAGRTEHLKLKGSFLFVSVRY